MYTPMNLNFLKLILPKTLIKTYFNALQSNLAISIKIKAHIFFN